MSFLISESIKTTAVNYIGIFIGAIYTLILAPSIFTPDYNGLSRLLLEVSVLLATYVQFGIPLVINRYYFRVVDVNKQSGGFDLFILGIPFIAVCLFIAVFGWFGHLILKPFVENAAMLVNYSKYLLMLVVCYVYLGVFEAYSAVLHKIVVVNLVRNFGLRVANVISVVAYYFTKDFELSLQILTGITFLAVLVNFFYINRLKKFDLKPSSAFLHADGMKRDLSKYIAYVVICNIGIFLIQKVDIIMLGAMSNLASVAYYTTAYFMVYVLLIPYQAVLNISFPVINKHFQRGEMNDAELLIKENALFSYFLSLVVFTIVWVNIDSCYEIMPNGREYAVGKYVFFFIGLGKLVDISIGSLGQLLTISKYYYLGLVLTVVVSFVSVALNYFFITNLGITGASIAMCITTAVYALLQLGIVYKLFKVHPYSPKFLTATAVWIAVTVSVYFISGFAHPLVMIVIKTILVIALFIFSNNFLNICPQVTTIVNGLLAYANRYRLSKGKEA